MNGRIVERIKRYYWATRGPLTSIKRWLSQHAFFAVAAVAAGLLLFFVPQVTNLWKQVPLGGYPWLGFLSLLALLVFLYGSSLLAFWKPGWAWRRGERGQLERRHGIWAPATFILDWLNDLVRWALPFSRGIAGYLFPLLLIFLGALALGLPDSWSGFWLMAGVFFQILGAWLLLVGVWLLVGRFLGPASVAAKRSQIPSHDPQEHDDRRTVWQTCGQVLGWFGAIIVVGELLWLTADLRWPGASFRLYSIWALTHLATTLLLAAALIDYLERETWVPWRLIALLLLVVAVSRGGPERIDDAVPGASSMPLAQRAEETESASAHLSTSNVSNSAKATDAAALWYAAANARLDTTRGPAVLIAASGGGSRAAIFTALVLRMLADEPFDFPDLDPYEDSASAVAGVRAESALRADEGTWADRVLLISAVSGGSLATSRYVQQVGKGAWPAADRISALQYTDTEELARRAHQRLIQWRDEAEGSPDPAAEQELARLRVAIEQWDEWQKTGANSSATIPYLSQLVDEMCIDFMAPILRGLMTPRSSRGQGLMHFWNDRFDWRDRSQANFQSNGFWNAARQPLMFLNTCDIGGGRRVVASFPRLPKGLLAVHRAVDGGGLVPPTSTAPIAMSDLLDVKPGDVLLGRAVRLSSNFPFGFPVSSLPGRSADSTPQTFHLLDGGVIDNSGLDAVHALVVGLHNAALGDPTSQAAHLLDRLRRRGVVILVIDSGAKPAASTGGAFRGLVQPYAGLNAATYTNAERMGEHLEADLHELLSDSARARRLRQLLAHAEPGDESPPGAAGNSPPVTTSVLIPPDRHVDPLGVLSYRLICNHIAAEDAHVMTAFALGPADKATVVAQFLVQRKRWEHDRRDLKDHFEEFDRYASQEAETDYVRAMLAKELLERSEQMYRDLAERLDQSESPAALATETAKLQALDATVTRALEPVRDRRSRELDFPMSRLADSVQPRQAAPRVDRPPGGVERGEGEERRRAVEALRETLRERARDLELAAADAAAEARVAAPADPPPPDLSSARSLRNLQQRLNQRARQQAEFYGKAGGN